MDPFQKRLKYRKIKAAFLKGLCIASMLTALVFLIVLLGTIIRDGMGFLNWSFITNFPSRIPANAGIQSALMGSIWLIVMTSIIAIPVGISASIYLEEFGRKNFLSKLIDINISNLAGVPSIVYGILGLTIFVRWFNLERSILSGALTMSLLILPSIIIVSREAIRAVPDSMRYAALALGATRWQMVKDHVLPAALPGFMTGIILAISRAIGETAPLLIIGALGFVAFNPQGLRDSFTVLPIQIFNWASRPQPEFHQLAASGIIVLLIVLLAMNFLAIYIRQRFSQENKR
ncbi:MAG: phosphate ABC transporter permease PstA [Bdellovibrionota bacterium]